MTPQETDRLRKLPQPEKNNAIRDIANDIYRATMNGTTEHTVVRDAIDRLKLLAEEPPRSGHAAKPSRPLPVVNSPAVAPR